MAYGQVDPARLQGEALTRWYLRSPAEIEQERREASERAHDEFFGFLGVDGQRADRIQVAEVSQARAPNTSRQQLAAGNARKWGYWGIDSCRDCHGYTLETLPPQRGHSPNPWNWPPLSRAGSTSSSPRPPREERPECEAQERSDRALCSRQPTGDAKAACYGTATRRQAHCNQTGDLGEPPLFTARRKSGGRWP